MKPGNQSTRAKHEARCRVLPFFFSPHPKKGERRRTIITPTTQGGRPTCHSVLCAQDDDEGPGGISFIVYNGVGNSEVLWFPYFSAGEGELRGIPQRCPFLVPSVA